MNLTKRQTALLIGTILGDAFLQKTGKHNARLRFEHSAAQKEYIVWKASVFGRLFSSKPKYLERKHPKTGAVYKYYRHQSESTPIFGEWHKVFYVNGGKKIPKNIETLLKNPLSLAVWYMDDGYYYAKDRNSYIYLGRVTRNEAEKAAQAISNNFNIIPRVYDKKKKGFALFFSVAETKKLLRVVGPHCIKLFAYKLGKAHSLTP
jgi:recombination protein RecA